MARTVEDALELISWNIWKPDIRDSLGPWMTQFVEDVTARIGYHQQPLTTAQAKIALDAIGKTSHVLSNDAFGKLVDNPVYRTPLRQSLVIPREVRWLGRQFLGFRFKLNVVVTQDFKNLISRNIFSDHQPAFDPQHNMWVIPVTGDNADDILKIISQHGFDFTDEVLEVIAQAKDGWGAAPAFVLDPETETIWASVQGNEIAQTWVRHVLGGEVDETDYRLPATSRIARRLADFQSLCPATFIDPAILELRGEDNPDPIVQELLDFDLRGSFVVGAEKLVAPREWLHRICQAAQIKGLKNVVARPNSWSRVMCQNICSLYDLEFRVLGDYHGVSEENARLRRDSVLILAHSALPNHVTNAWMAEFPHVVSLGAVGVISNLSMFGLFPPHAIMTKVEPLYLSRLGMSDRRNRYARLFNISLGMTKCSND